MSAPRILRDRQLRGGTSKQLYSSSAFVRNLDIAHELRGHTGCVNALCWSDDGHYLASGSDDTHVFIWDAHAAYDNTHIIHTGHTRNIFSVKFVPDTGNCTLISAAGDRTIRILDVEYGGAAVKVMHEPSVRTVYRAHHDRVKRLAVEDSHCFLSCSEDGDIRQFDLRESNSSSSGYRAPLISYAKYQIDLNTISLNKVNPYLLALGGSHPCAFLHDRRMAGRDLKNEWGSIPTSGAPTQCVKKFRSAKTEQSLYRGEQITALHFGNKNPRELLCSWSCDDVYLFDIHGETDQRPGSTISSSSKSRTSTSGTAQKRKRSDSPKDDSLELVDGLDAFDLLHSTRSYLLAPPFFGRDYTSAYRKYQEALEVALTRYPSRGSPLLLHHLCACGDVLRALSEGVSSMPPGVEHDIPLPLTCSTIETITRSFCLHSLDPTDRKPLPELPPHLQDSPVIDITLPSSERGQLFGSFKAMVEAFNATISSPEMIRSTHQTEQGRKFWIEKVCRSLLAAGESQVRALERPEIDGTDDGHSISDDSDVDEEGDDVRDDGDDDSNEISDYDYDAHQEYLAEVKSAIENVSAGVPTGVPLRSFNGHINVETVKDVNFFGLDDEYVMSGSDDGLLFIWEKTTGRVVTMLQGDDSVVNVMEGHPHMNTLAVSGIDDTVKIFQPFEATDDEETRIGSRRVKQTEYEIRARNASASRGEEIVEVHGGHRISRRMLMGLEDGETDESERCRMQ